MEKQLLATLIRIRSYRNGASLTKIYNLFRMKKGTVDKVCNQIIIAIQSNNLRTIYVRWPAKSTRKEAKKWIEK